MTDKEIIRDTAEFWLRNGGDAEGFSWVWSKILEELRRLEDEVKET